MSSAIHRSDLSDIPYSCPKINAVLEALTDIEAELESVVKAPEHIECLLDTVRKFSAVYAELENIRGINDSLRTIAKDLVQELADVESELEEARTEIEQKRAQINDCEQIIRDREESLQEIWRQGHHSY